MSQHGCPERLSNRSKGFQDDGPSQPTMEVLVETLTGTAFEMTVLPTDTIFAIKSKIFRVEGIPVSQQHLLYNLKELEDSSSLREHAIGDGARLRLVLGMRGGPISTRRLPPPPNAEPWRDIERLLDTNRDDVEWGGSGCKVTVLVFRDGERVNMLRVKENHDGTYSPLEHNKYSSTSSSLTKLVERGGSSDTSGAGAGGAGAGGAGAGGAGAAGAGSRHDNAVTMGKMLELRRRMESLSVQRTTARTDHRDDKVEIQKTRSEETLSVPSLLDESPSEGLKQRAASYAPFSDAEEGFAPLYDGRYTRYDYECGLADVAHVGDVAHVADVGDVAHVGELADRYTLLPGIGAGRAAADEAERLDLELELDLVLASRRDAPDDAAILEECLDADDCRLAPDETQLTANNLAPIQADYGPLVCGSARGWVSLGGAGGGGGGGGGCGGGGGPRRGAHSQSASSLHVRAPPPRRAAPLSDALFSSSTSDLEKLKRNSRILPALSRHRPREHLHLSDERLDTPRRRSPPAAPAPAPAPAPGAVAPAPAAPAPRRARCGLCRKRLSIATLHRCRCGGSYCAPHRYAEVHGCCYDYRGAAGPPAPAPLLAPKLPRI